MPHPITKTNRTIVLDLDSTLIHSSQKITEFEALKLYTNPSRAHLRQRVYHLEMRDSVTEIGEGEVEHMWGFYRPYLFEFLAFSSEYFQHVVIWSAGFPRYVEALCRNLFPDPHFQPTIVYTRDDLEVVNEDKGVIFKTLTRLYEDNRAVGMNPATTLALDDRWDVLSKNPHNGIVIPAYEPPHDIRGVMEDDVALLQLMTWLERPDVAKAKDVRTLSKKQIFDITDLQPNRYIKHSYTPHSFITSYRSPLVLPTI